MNIVLGGDDMLVDEIWDFKSINMGRELEISGEFIYESARKTMSITGLNNQYEINIILYTGAVGIERLQKIYLCLVQQNPNDKDSVPKCLMGHNHLELEKEIEKYTMDKIPKNGKGLLGIFAEYYNNYRYANYIPKINGGDLRLLFISFLKKQNGKFNFDEPCSLSQFEVFKRFYINELGKIAGYFYGLIEHKARDINTYTYEIDSSSNAARVFWSTRGRSLYEQMLIEQNAIKELLLYIYKNQRDSGVFRLLNHMESLEMDDTLINDYLADLFEGKVNDWLIDYVDDMYEEIGDIKKIKERKKLLSLFGDRSVYFDFEDLEDIPHREVKKKLANSRGKIKYLTENRNYIQLIFFDKQMPCVAVYDKRQGVTRSYTFENCVDDLTGLQYPLFEFTKGQDEFIAILSPMDIENAGSELTEKGKAVFKDVNFVDDDNPILYIVKTE